MVEYRQGPHFEPYVNSPGRYDNAKMLPTDFDAAATDEIEQDIDEVLQGVTPRMEALNGVLGVGETAPEDVCCWTRRVE